MSKAHIHPKFMLLAATTAALLLGCDDEATRRGGGGGGGGGGSVGGGSVGGGSVGGGSTGDAGSSGGFDCVGPCVGGLDLSIPNGRPYAGGLPTATNTGAEPVITGTEWIREDDDTLLLVVTAEPDVAFNQIYIEINAQVFIIDSMESLVDAGRLDFCGVLESSQGIACTDACITACQCVLCADDLVEHNARGSCTTTCSTWASNGLIGPGQAHESEVQMANFVYNGDPAIGVTGLAGQTECTADVCAASAQRAAQRAEQRLSFEFHFDFADPIPDSIVVAQSGGGGGGDSPAVSQPAGAASLRAECCPAYGACAMACQ